MPRYIERQSRMVSTPFPLFLYLILFLGRAGSSLLRGVFPSCGQRGLFSSCCARALHCGGLSCCRAWLLRHVGSAAVAPEFQSTGSVLAHGLSCSALYGIFPDQESNACLLRRQADSLPLSHQGSPSCLLEHWFSTIVHHHSSL